MHNASASAAAARHCMQALMQQPDQLIVMLDATRDEPDEAQGPAAAATSHERLGRSWRPRSSRRMLGNLRAGVRD